MAFSLLSWERIPEGVFVHADNSFCIHEICCVSLLCAGHMHDNHEHPNFRTEIRRWFMPPRTVDHTACDCFWRQVQTRVLKTMYVQLDIILQISMDAFLILIVCVILNPMIPIPGRKHSTDSCCLKGSYWQRAPACAGRDRWADCRTGMLSYAFAPGRFNGNIC